MKVLGKSGSSTYICEVSHHELEKMAGKFYGNLPDLKIGDTFDLGAGHNFHDAIRQVGSTTTDAIKTFERHMPTLTRFMALVGNLPPVAESDAPVAEGGKL